MAALVLLSSSGLLNTTPEDHSTFSLFDLLPSELLILILSFAIHLTEDNISSDRHDESRHRIRFPYTALRVSKQWHDIVMTTPDMWTVVRIWAIHHDLTADAKAHASAVGRRMDLHWERSGRRPLHVHIDARKWAFPDISKVLKPKLVIEGMVWKSLQIVGWSSAVNELLYDLFSSTHGITNTVTIDDLQVVDVRPRTPLFYDEPASVWLKGALSNLRHIHLRRYSQSLFPLPHLQSLCMDNVHPDAIAIFSRIHFPNLTILVIHFDPNNSIKHNEAENSSANRSFDLPNLRSTVLYNVKDYTVKTILAGAPNLEDLAISSVDRTWDLQYLTGFALAPRMSSLTIYNPLFLDVCVREVVASRIPGMARITLDEDAASDESGVMGWMKDQVEVRLVPMAKLSFVYMASNVLPQKHQRPIWSNDL